jgi:hypothetical protein
LIESTGHRALESLGFDISRQRTKQHNCAFENPHRQATRTIPQESYLNSCTTAALRSSEPHTPLAKRLQRRSLLAYAMDHKTMNRHGAHYRSARSQLKRTAEPEREAEDSYEATDLSKSVMQIAVVEFFQKSYTISGRAQAKELAAPGAGDSHGDRVVVGGPRPGGSGPAIGER